jgi:hypothetical protein
MIDAYKNHIYTDIMRLEDRKRYCPAEEKEKLSAEINLLVASKFIIISKLIQSNTYIVNPKEYKN